MTANTLCARFGALLTEPTQIIRRLSNAIPQGGWALALAALALRWFAGRPYYASGLTKWDNFPFVKGDGWGFEQSFSVGFLFEDEYKLHILGGVYDMPFPEISGWIAGFGEIVFPILLLLGLGTRFAALGLLGMTAVIQLTYPGGFLLHAGWALMLVLILLIGPGRLSLDWLIGRRLR